MSVPTTALHRFIAVSIAILVAAPAVLAEEPEAPGIPIEALDQMPELPAGLAPLPERPPEPPDNAATPNRIALGRRLFFEQALSGDRSMSCASCHDPRWAFADPRALSPGFGGAELGRHSPTILNAAYNSAQFWDGRALSLEEQAVGPITSPAEMNLPEEAVLVSRLSAVREYRDAFAVAYDGEISLRSVARAIASFERTLVTPGTRFDRYAAGDKSALSEEEKRGLLLFIGKAACSQCHNGPNLTDNQFHNLGFSKADQDPGRAGVTRDPADLGSFKTPTLRNITLTAPYMHDGRIATLPEVIAYYDRGGEGGARASDKIFALELTESEKADLLAFLASLAGPRAPMETAGFEDARSAEDAH